MKRSEKYRAIADLFAYAEQKDWEAFPVSLTDNGESIEVLDSLYQELASNTSNLLDAVKTCGITIYRHDADGNYVGADSEVFDWFVETSAPDSQSEALAVPQSLIKE